MIGQGRGIRAQAFGLAEQLAEWICSALKDEYRRGLDRSPSVLGAGPSLIVATGVGLTLIQVAVKAATLRTAKVRRLTADTQAMRTKRRRFDLHDPKQSFGDRNS